jgi:hypothetical protein
MKAKIKLVPYSPKLKTVACIEPFEGADHAVVVGTLCFGCGTSPFKVAGTGRRIAPDDRAYEADAVSLCCKTGVGVLRVETGTLFGLREDEAVLRMGVRIY